MDLERFDAAILDMDGVITRTARVHARAWKRMFDEFLQGWSQREGNDQPPFDIETDYGEYLDGKPRYDGVRSFLASRNIELPEGDPDDPPDAQTVCGLGNRKNELFHELLRDQGVEVYDDAVEQIRAWKQRGLKVAVVTSSRNGEQVLEAAGVTDLFEVRIDGNDSAELGLEGKPAPDIFLEAARQLGVVPSRAFVLEDAIAGVRAGRAGDFGLVVGVARDVEPEKLRRRGADVAVRDLRELDEIDPSQPSNEGSKTAPSSALGHLDEIQRRLAQQRLALFLDYDGTLTPIVEDPAQALLPGETRSLLERLAALCTVAIVSGRDLADVKNMVGLENLVYAGSHGFDISGPNGLAMQQEDAVNSMPDLDEAEQELRGPLADVAGAVVERKRFAIAVHYRRVAEQDVARVEDVLDEVAARHPSLRKMEGKKVFELQPDVEWDKGRAVLWLREALGVQGEDTVTIYVGDDVTDEDAFRALSARRVGIGIVVAPPAATTHARHYLRDCAEVRQFLRRLLDFIRTKHDD